DVLRHLRHGSVVPRQPGGVDGDGTVRISEDVADDLRLDDLFLTFACTGGGVGDCSRCELRRPGSVRDCVCELPAERQAVGHHRLGTCGASIAKDSAVIVLDGHVSVPYFGHTSQPVRIALRDLNCLLTALLGEVPDPPRTSHSEEPHLTT